MADAAIDEEEEGIPNVVWYLESSEAQIYLALETLKYKPPSKPKLPIQPRVGTSKAGDRAVKAMHIRF